MSRGGVGGIEMGAGGSTYLQRNTNVMRTVRGMYTASDPEAATCVAIEGGSKEHSQDICIPFLFALLSFGSLVCY